MKGSPNPKNFNSLGVRGLPDMLILSCASQRYLQPHFAALSCLLFDVYLKNLKNRLLGLAKFTISEYAQYKTCNNCFAVILCRDSRYTLQKTSPFTVISCSITVIQCSVLREKILDPDLLRSYKISKMLRLIAKWRLMRLGSRQPQYYFQVLIKTVYRTVKWQHFIKIKPFTPNCIYIKNFASYARETQKYLK